MQKAALEVHDSNAGKPVAPVAINAEEPEEERGGTIKEVSGRFLYPLSLTMDSARPPHITGPLILSLTRFSRFPPLTRPSSWKEYCWPRRCRPSHS
jgi:hypothetical protein